MTKYTEDRLHMTSEFPEIQQFYITYQCSVKQTVLKKFMFDDYVCVSYCRNSICANSPYKEGSLV